MSNNVSLGQLKKFLKLFTNIEGNANCKRGDNHRELPVHSVSEIHEALDMFDISEKEDHIPFSITTMKIKEEKFIVDMLYFDIKVEHNTADLSIDIEFIGEMDIASFFNAL